MSDLQTPVLAGLLLTPLLISVGQIFFKIVSGTAGRPDIPGLIAIATNPVLIAALALYGVGTLVWIFVLKHVPLTLAYPFMALTFCAVPALAWFFLGEAIGIRYAAGVVLIITGLIVIGAG